MSDDKTPTPEERRGLPSPAPEDQGLSDDNCSPVPGPKIRKRRLQQRVIKDRLEKSLETKKAVVEVLQLYPTPMPRPEDSLDIGDKMRQGIVDGKIEPIDARELEALVKIRNYAQAQSSDMQLACILVRDFDYTHSDAVEFLQRHIVEINAYRLAARGDISLLLYQIATGEVTPTQVQVAVLVKLAQQVLGWTDRGIDERMRRAIEQAERQISMRRSGT